jgi:ABC-2 type transport system ATP-binding protein
VIVSAPASISVQHLDKRYGARLALADVSFSAHGGVVTLLGPNGAGKTSLLRCLATVLAADGGAVFVDGLDPLQPDERTQIRRRLGYLPQEPRFASNATVFDVVDYLAIVKEVGPTRSRRAEVGRVLRDVGLGEHLGQKVKTLSGGMVRRIGIAQAMLGTPSLVVLDEPAAGLDPDQRLLLRDRLSRLGESATVVLSTHLTEEAAAFSQSLYVLDGGRVVYAGTPGGLTATARGRVWLSETPPAPGPGLRRSWRTPTGVHRCIGDPPPGATLDEPTLEDAYLLLVGAP